MKKYDVAPPISVIRCTDPLEFIEELRINNPQWGWEIECDWVFRGHSNSTWRLIPHAWRDEGRVILSELISRYSIEVDRLCQGNIPLDVERKNAIAEAAAQLRAVHDFAALCDSLGMFIPNDGNVDILRTLRTAVASAKGDGKFWELFKTGEAAAFAQHHGIPTALLDWTKDPLVSAYFAAQDCEEDCELMAVWAVKRGALRQLQTPEGNRVQVKTVQHHNFEFLHAQDAVFLYFDGGLEYFFRFQEWPALENVIMAMADDGDSVLRMFTLPRKDANMVSRLLHREKRSLAHLSPTYDNVCKTVIRSWSWDF